MSGTPLLGRNARLIIAGVVVAFGKNISVKATAEIIKDYSMDSLTPAVTGAGKQSYTWSCDRLATIDGAFLTKLVSGTVFTMIFAPIGTSTAPFITLTGCVVLDFEESAGETGAVLMKVSGEAQTMVSTDA